MPATPRRARRFGGDAAHQRLMMANLVASLVAAEAIVTTEASIPVKPNDRKLTAPIEAATSTMQTAMKMALRRPISDPVAGLVWPQPLQLARIRADSRPSSHTLHKRTNSCKHCR